MRRLAETTPKTNFSWLLLRWRLGVQCCWHVSCMVAAAGADGDAFIYITVQSQQPAVLNTAQWRWRLL